MPSAGGSPYWKIKIPRKIATTQLLLDLSTSCNPRESAVFNAHDDVPQSGAEVPGSVPLRDMPVQVFSGKMIAHLLSTALGPVDLF